MDSISTISSEVALRLSKCTYSHIVKPLQSPKYIVMFGTIDSGISMNYLSTNYVQLDCGSVSIDKYVGCFMDNDPYTKISIYLPFIGIRQLSADDCIGRSLHVVYNIDVLTGACACFVEVSGRGVLYSYNGSCITNVPLTAVNFSGAIQNAVSAIGSAIGIAAGMATGAAPVTAMSIAGLATPSFWLAVLLILIFSSYLHLLPASGPLPNPATDFGGYLARMIMPAISLAVPLTGQMTRIVRTAMVEELDKDYVRTAKGSGLPKGVIIAKNVLRNALITPVTTLGMKIGYLMGGAVVIEVIFNLPGMGMAILDGVSGNEPMLVMGVVIVVALSFIIINIVVDMLYLLINPRIRSV